MLRKRLKKCAVGVACLLLLVMAAWAAENSLFPALDGTEQYTGGNVVIDASHKDQGYFMAAYTGGGSKRLKLRTTKDGKTYTFDLNGEGEYEVFPLQMGDGAYQIEVFRQVKGNSYSSEFSQRIDVALQQENLPFLYPNQYVWYEPEGDIVALSDQLCCALETDAEKVAAVEDYIAQNMTYDYDKARTVQSGYLPDVEEIIDSNTGICFDLSAVVASLLRLQSIPTRLIVGYADGYYHAWNEILVDGEWQRYDGTAVVTNSSMKAYVEDQRY